MLENRNLEGVEVGVQLVDLDSSCSGGLFEGEGSAVECYLTQHGLPPCKGVKRWDSMGGRGIGIIDGILFVSF